MAIPRVLRTSDLENKSRRVWAIVSSHAQQVHVSTHYDYPPRVEKEDRAPSGTVLDLFELLDPTLTLDNIKSAWLANKGQAIRKPIPPAGPKELTKPSWMIDPPKPIIVPKSSYSPIQRIRQLLRTVRPSRKG